jgi:hypothetical protein
MACPCRASSTFVKKNYAQLKNLLTCNDVIPSNIQCFSDAIVII